MVSPTMLDLDACVSVSFLEGKRKMRIPNRTGLRQLHSKSRLGELGGGLSSTQRIMDVGSRQSVVYYSDSQAPESTFSN